MEIENENLGEVLMDENHEENDAEYALMTKLVDQDKFEIMDKQNNFKFHQEKENKRVISKLWKICIFCSIFMVIELVGGYIAGSLAIMTDAAHLLSDLSGFIISIISLFISLRPANYHLSYGYHRAEIIGAMVSILIIWILTAWLLTEAYNRLYHPEPIDALIMMSIASCGLLFNLIMAKILTSNEDIPNAFEDDPKVEVKDLAYFERQGDDQSQHNQSKITEDGDKKNAIMRATVIHILGDIIQSVGVLAAAMLIYFLKDTHPSIIKADPICTFIFGVIVLSTSIPVAKDCINVLMEASPSHIDQDGLLRDLKSIRDIVDFHDIHIWSLSLGKIAMTAHFISNNPQKTLEEATDICKKYGIFHSTIQVEDYTQRRRHSFKLCTHINDNQIH